MFYPLAAYLFIKGKRHFYVLIMQQEFYIRGENMRLHSDIRG